MATCLFLACTTPTLAIEQNVAVLSTDPDPDVAGATIGRHMAYAISPTGTLVFGRGSQIDFYPSLVETAPTIFAKAPDESPQVLYRSSAVPGFPGQEFVNPLRLAINSSDQVMAYMADNVQPGQPGSVFGIWFVDAQGIRKVLREGETPSGGFQIDAFAPFERFNELGQIGVAAGGDSTGDDKAYYLDDAGSLEIRALSGLGVPGVAGKAIAGMGTGVLNNAGTAAFRTGIEPTEGIHNTGIFVSTPGGTATLATLAVQNMEVSGMPAGFRFNSLNPVFGINDAGTVAFSGKASGAGYSFGDTVWKGTPGSLTNIAHEDDPVTDRPGLAFEGFSIHVLINHHGETLFAGEVNGTGVDSSNDEALFFVDAQDTLYTLFREGDAVPGLPGVAFAMPSFSLFYSVNRHGHTAFQTKLSGAGVDFSNDDALWVTDENHQLFLVAREGDVLDVGGGAQTILNLHSHFGSGVENGMPLSLNDRGEFVYRATFSDGSKRTDALIVVTIPEPSTLVLAAFSLLGLLAFGRRSKR